MRRRKVLAACGVGLVSGCLRLDSGDDEETSVPPPTSSTTVPPSTRTEGRSTPSPTTTRDDGTGDGSDPTDTPEPSTDTPEDTSGPSTTTYQSITVGDNWRRFQAGVANDGQHPTTTGPTEGVTEAWQFSTTETDQPEWSNFNPVVADGSVYVTSQDDHVYSLDVETGAVQWQFTTEVSESVSDDPRRKCTPAVVDGTVYAEGPGGFVYALDAATGEEEWALRQNAGNIPTTPLVRDGTVYLGQGTLFALSERDGSLQWDRRIAVTDLAFGDDTLFAVSVNRQRLYALDPRTGETYWTFDGPTGSPSYADGVVYASAGRVDGASPALYAVNASDGTERWRRSLPGELPGVFAPPVANGRVFVTPKSTRSVHALSTADGSEQWQYQTLGRVVGPPTVVDGHVYLGGRSNKVHCVRARDGERQWVQVFPSSTNSPTVVDDAVLVGTGMGDVWALTETS